jgi:hypothetical protein
MTHLGTNDSMRVFGSMLGVKRTATNPSGMSTKNGLAGNRYRISLPLPHRPEHHRVCLIAGLEGK